MQHDVLIQPYEHHLDDYGNEDEQQTSTEEASSNDGEASVEEPQVSDATYLMHQSFHKALKNLSRIRFWHLSFEKRIRTGEIKTLVTNYFCLN